MDFDNNPSFDCDSDAFVIHWPKYGANLRAVTDEQIATEWEQSIENLLLLLNAFPVKPNQLPFLDAIKKLIVFRVVILIEILSDFSISLISLN